MTVAAARTSTAGSRPRASWPSSARALVDLYGQHAHQSLLDPAVQRGALDRFAGAAAADALARVPRRARGDPRVDDDLAALGGDAHARAREIDLLRFQVEEIAAAAIDDPGEEVALEAEELLLADAVAHRDALGRARTPRSKVPRSTRSASRSPSSTAASRSPS